MGKHYTNVGMHGDIIMELVFGGSWPSVVYHRASHRLVRPNTIRHVDLGILESVTSKNRGP